MMSMEEAKMEHYFANVTTLRLVDPQREEVKALQRQRLGTTYSHAPGLASSLWKPTSDPYEDLEIMNFRVSLLCMSVMGSLLSPSRTELNLEARCHHRSFAVVDLKATKEAMIYDSINK